MGLRDEFMAVEYRCFVIENFCFVFGCGYGLFSVCGVDPSFFFLVDSLFRIGSDFSFLDGDCIGLCQFPAIGLENKDFRYSFWTGSYFAFDYAAEDYRNLQQGISNGNGIAEKRFVAG